MKKNLTILIAIFLLSICFLWNITALAEDTDSAQEEGSPTFETIAIGSESDNVKNFQEKLNELGFSVGEADGKFGVKTEEGLKSLQKAKGWEETGVIDSESQLEEILSIEVIRRESEGEEVKQLQEKLNELGYSVGDADGKFGAKTEEGLIALQKDRNWDETGVIGIGTQLSDVLSLTRGDGSNLLASTDYHIEKDNKSELVESKIFDIADIYNLSYLIGKNVTVSIYVNSPGERNPSPIETEESMKDRFGCHMQLVWSDSQGNREDLEQYPAANLLRQTVDDKRISESVLVSPPEGYDTLKSVSVVVQSVARPADGNPSVWKLGYPKLELGSFASEWAPNSLDAFNVSQ